MGKIYQELFPTFFLLSKSLDVSCPPHQIGGIGAGNISSEIDEMKDITLVQENMSSPEVVKQELTSESELENLDIIQPNM